jgi:A/G-specific adenine glycosylase
VTPRDREIARAVEGWFVINARDLPWRRRRDGYAALVSEAMLQQTQVSRVIEAFARFMRRFPDVRALAGAREQDVLAAWQGMGYYRRARHLHAAARVIVRDHAGAVPEDVESLRALPGVGRYTAGAIASIVFGRREPIVDGNVARVLARLHAREEAIDATESVAWTWSRARALVNAAGDPGRLNEGLMELGATVCVPASPKCGECPAARWCQARRRGVEREVPPPKKAAAPRSVHHHAVIIQRADGRVLIERRSPDGMWSNMWQAPTVEADHELRARSIASALRVAVQGLSRINSFAHATTHRTITFHVYSALLAEGTSAREVNGGRAKARLAWIDPAGDARGTPRPMSVPQRRIMALAAGGGFRCCGVKAKVARRPRRPVAAVA